MDESDDVLLEKTEQIVRERLTQPVNHVIGFNATKN